MPYYQPIRQSGLKDLELWMQGQSSSLLVRHHPYIVCNGGSTFLTRVLSSLSSPPQKKWVPIEDGVAPLTILDPGLKLDSIGPRVSGLGSSGKRAFKSKSKGHPPRTISGHETSRIRLAVNNFSEDFAQFRTVRSAYWWSSGVGEGGDFKKPLSIFPT